jgi:hypothetical protein
MENHRTLMTLAGGLIFVLATTSCSSTKPTRTAANSPPRDSVVDRTVSTEVPVPTNRTGAGDNPYDSNRVVGCADQKSDQTASMDCGPRNPRMDRDRLGNDRAMAACTYRMDTRGNVIYDDPACPTRYSQVQPMVKEYRDPQVLKDNAFFDRYIEKAVKEARQAEIAGNQGHASEMVEHANLALTQAKQAQRAGNVPGLNEGILALREALAIPLATYRGRTAYDSPTGTAATCTSRTDANGTVIYDDPNCPLRYGQTTRDSLQDATAYVREARIRLSEAGGMRPVDTRAPGVLAANTSSMAGTPARTVTGILISDEAGLATSRFDGVKPYYLRDRNGRDIPVVLPPDMARTVGVGDRVVAQVDSDGRILAISKDQ